MAPSPKAEAQRFTDPCRTSPAANPQVRASHQVAPLVANDSQFLSPSGTGNPAHTDEEPVRLEDRLLAGRFAARSIRKAHRCGAENPGSCKPVETRTFPTA